MKDTAEFTLKAFPEMVFEASTGGEVPDMPGVTQEGWINISGKTEGGTVLWTVGFQAPNDGTPMLATSDGTTADDDEQPEIAAAPETEAV